MFILEQLIVASSIILIIVMFILYFMIGIVILNIYFLPAIIAFKTKHRNILSIFILNLLLGWTFIGWTISLVWACKE